MDEEVEISQEDEVDVVAATSRRMNFLASMVPQSGICHELENLVNVTCRMVQR